MKKHQFFRLLLILCFVTTTALAQTPIADTAVKHVLPPIRKFFIGMGTDAGIFSTARIQQTTTLYNPAGGTTTSTTNTYGTLRFSYILNLGLSFNFNLNRHLGLYTGIDVKNIGFIQKNDAGETVKQRTYNAGVPIGIKIGNMADKRGYAFLGGGADAPINYKEKVFVIRNEKQKYSEWFSKATPAIMPYVFAGLAIKQGVSFKVQYYPNNYLNPDYTNKTGFPSNSSYTNVQLIMFSIGFTVPLSKQPGLIKKQVSGLNTATM